MMRLVAKILLESEGLMVELFTVLFDGLFAGLQALCRNESVWPMFPSSDSM